MGVCIVTGTAGVVLEAKAIGFSGVEGVVELECSDTM